LAFLWNSVFGGDRRARLNGKLLSFGYINCVLRCVSQQLRDM
jgi:hypothetical protein